jgi:hypothetical protein
MCACRHGCGSRSTAHAHTWGGGGGGGKGDGGRARWSVRLVAAGTGLSRLPLVAAALPRGLPSARAHKLIERHDRVRPREIATVVI